MGYDLLLKIGLKALPWLLLAAAVLAFQIQGKVYRARIDAKDTEIADLRVAVGQAQDAAKQCSEATARLEQHYAERQKSLAHAMEAAHKARQDAERKARLTLQVKPSVLAKTDAAPVEVRLADCDSAEALLNSKMMERRKP